MRIQRPLVVLKNQAVRYRKLEVTQGRVRMKVDENSIHFEPSPNPNDPPFFVIYDRSGDGGTAGVWFFTEYTRPSGRKVFVF